MTTSDALLRRATKTRIFLLSSAVFFFLFFIMVFMIDLYVIQQYFSLFFVAEILSVQR